MRSIRLASCIALVVLALCSALVASAQSVTKDDRGGDAVAAIDIMAVRYTNARKHVSEVVLLADLNASARIHLGIGLRGERSTYIAVFTKRDGRLRRRLVLNAENGPYPSLPCHVRGEWRARQNQVSLIVPWRCLELRKGPLAMRAFTLQHRELPEGSGYDDAPRVVVRRG